MPRRLSCQYANVTFGETAGYSNIPFLGLLKAGAAAPAFNVYIMTAFAPAINLR